MELDGSSIPARFQAVAARYPQHVAIGSGTWQPSYVELDHASGSLAETLRSRCARGSRIALLQSLDGYLIGSILGVLKAAQTVAVFNPSDPQPRLRQNLVDLEPAVIVCDATTQELASQVAPPEVTVIAFTGAINADLTVSVDAPSPEDLAFLIQTSGSTGHPKWVMQTHRNVLDNVHRHNREMRIQADDRMLLLASPSGSQAVATIFCALLHGAAVCPFPVADKGIIGLAGWMRQHKISVYVSAASALRHTLRTLEAGERLPAVRLVKVGAEAILSSDLVAAASHFRDDCVFYCTYSCAEVGNMMQYRWSSGAPSSDARVPLGKPSDGVEVLLCGDDGNPVAPGETGQIVVRSEFLSAGYWRNESLTAERFSAPHTYRTGDLGRRDANGELYCIGRRDDLVKIRGNNVAVAEVELLIASLDGVQECAVCVRRTAGAASLAAFVVARPGARIDPESIRLALSAELPPHMHPAEIVMLDRLPLSAHGKIDREALLESSKPASAPLEAEQGSTPAETLLLTAWRAVFEARRVNRESSFFDLGGDSLTAAVIAAKLHSALAIELNMSDFVRHPRLRELAAFIQAPSERSSPHLPIPKVSDRSAHPLSFNQEGIWRHCRESVDANRIYSVSRSLGLLGDLDVEALRKAMERVVSRNEILRTTFPAVHGQPAQVVQPLPSTDLLPLIDLSHHADSRDRAMAVLREQSLVPLDLERGPLLRHTLIRIAPQEHWLIRIGHHILYDAWSWKLYFAQLESAYESILQGRSFSHESEPLQYGDYAAWERSAYAPGTVARAELVSWWKNALAGQPRRMGRTFPHPLLFRKTVKPSDGRCSRDLDDAFMSRLSELARSQSTTQYVIGLAAFGALLAATARRSHVMVGTHMTNRARPELQGMLGNFSRMAPICLAYPGTGSLLDWLMEVRQRVYETQMHAQLPREETWQDLRALGAKPPEVEMVFSSPQPLLPTRFAGLEMIAHTHRFDGMATEHQSAASMPMGFSLNLGQPCEVNFDARTHNPDIVRPFLDAYVRLLDLICQDPGQPLVQAVRTAQRG